MQSVSVLGVCSQYVYSALITKVGQGWGSNGLFVFNEMGNYKLFCGSTRGNMDLIKSLQDILSASLFNAVAKLSLGLSSFS